MTKQLMDVDRVMDCLWNGGKLRESPYPYKTDGDHPRGLAAAHHVVNESDEPIGAVHWKTFRWLLDNGFIVEAGNWMIEPEYKRISLREYKAAINDQN